MLGAKSKVIHIGTSIDHSHHNIGVPSLEVPCLIGADMTCARGGIVITSEQMPLVSQQRILNPQRVDARVDVGLALTAAVDIRIL